MLSTSQPTCLLIADISGYTNYPAGVEIDHAQDILADLVGTIVTALRPTFRLAKLEGDAAFMYAPVDKVDGSLLLDASSIATSASGAAGATCARPHRASARPACGSPTSTSSSSSTMARRRISGWPVGMS